MRTETVYSHQLTVYINMTLLLQEILAQEGKVENTVLFHMLSEHRPIQKQSILQ